MMGPMQRDPAVLIPAAGAGRRFGRDKAAARVRGVRNLDRIARTLRAVGLERPLVVTGARAEEHRRVRWAEPLRWTVHAGWCRGRTSSLQHGLRRLAHASAVLIWPVDLPLVREDTLRALLDAWRERPEAWLVQVTHEGRAGHPFLLHHRLAARLRELGADESPRPLLRRVGDEHRLRIPVADPAIHADMDEPRDRFELERLVRTRRLVKLATPA